MTTRQSSSSCTFVVMYRSETLHDHLIYCNLHYEFCSYRFPPHPHLSPSLPTYAFQSSALTNSSSVKESRRAASICIFWRLSTSISFICFLKAAIKSMRCFSSTLMRASAASARPLSSTFRPPDPLSHSFVPSSEQLSPLPALIEYP